MRQIYALPKNDVWFGNRRIRANDKGNFYNTPETNNSFLTENESRKERR